MDAIRIEYASMNLGVIAAWLLVATLAGYLARIIVRGRPVFGLWGDAAFGLLGVFVMGTLLRAIDFDLAAFIMDTQPKLDRDVAIWADVVLAALLGALLLRVAVRPVTGRKKA
jgi:uncharacterized membrane protein YeaQ/YmgE (transglycosylase-associated protein family)